VFVVVFVLVVALLSNCCGDSAVACVRGHLKDGQHFAFHGSQNDTSCSVVVPVVIVIVAVVVVVVVAFVVVTVICVCQWSIEAHPAFYIPEPVERRHCHTCLMQCCSTRVQTRNLS